MMESVMLSVVVPVYRVETYLDRCIQSILLQNHKGTEIILIDDGSSDLCGRICDEYARKNKTISVIHKKNGGLSDARNAGIKVASGKYISCIDSDDYINEGMFNDLCGSLEELNADIAICGFDMIYQDGVVHRIEYKDEVLSSHKGLCDMLFRKEISFSAWNKIYKRSLFSGMEYPVGLLYEDYYLTPRLMMDSQIIILRHGTYYNYCIRNDSIMGESNRKLSKDIVTVSMANYDYFKKRKKSLQTETYQMIIGGIIIHLYECTRQVFLPKDIKDYRSYINAYRNCVFRMTADVICNNNIEMKMKLKIILSALIPDFFSFAMQKSRFHRINE